MNLLKVFDLPPCEISIMKYWCLLELEHLFGRCDLKQSLKVVAELEICSESLQVILAQERGLVQFQAKA